MTEARRQKKILLRFPFHRLRNFFAVLALTAAVSLAGYGTVADAGEVSQPSSGKSVLEDAADLLTSEEEAAVLQELQQLSRQMSWSCFALTTQDAGGKTAREYADDYVDTNAFEEDGVCFLIDMDNREIYLSTTGEAIRYLTDRRIDRILDEGYTQVSQGYYGDCFLAMIRQTEDFCKQGIYMDQYNQDEESGRRDPYQGYEREPELTLMEILVAFVAAFLAAGGVILAVVRRYRLKVSDFRYDFHGNSRMKFHGREDRLVNQYVRHRHIPRETSSGGGGSHVSTTHRSSGGGTHGGGGRKF